MKRGFRGLTVLCSLLLIFAPETSYAQQTAPSPQAAEGTDTVAAPALSPEQKRVEMEINTSTLPELAAWCRTLGLSEGGTKTDLISRLRSHFKLPLAAGEVEDTRKLITIEAARSTEYFKLEVVDEEYARLTGEVRVSLKDGDATHRIKAWEILFNRTRNILTASGGVEYIKEQEDSVETFRGESITVNLDNWTSIFLDGESVRSVPNEDTSYRFSGTVISRNDQEVTVLSKATIGNATNPEAIWSLNASRVWLLPGSDFAIFNAVLKVGEIPVMYIPFFYYPADEMIFHPVIGYRSREGSFAQTTTYILGRPKASSSSESSLTKVLGNSSDIEKRREGLFLRSTGKKIKDPDSTSLKAMVDYYTNLGAYIGAELTTVKFGVLNPVNLSLGVGLTRTLIQLNTGYTPFAPKYDGSTDWNSSNLFSTEVPFRYRLKLDSSISGKYGSLTWNFPYYSDPWVDRDFMDRAETMDWINMVQQGAAVQDDAASDSQLGDYQWQLLGSVNPSISKLSPYITSLSLSSITSTMAFKTIDVSSRIPYSVPINDPSRFPPNTAFYAPDRFTIYSMSASIAGTPLTVGADSFNRTSTGGAGQDSSGEDPFKNIGVPRSPWETADSAPGQSHEVKDRLTPPVLNQRFDLPWRGGPQFSVDYRLAPTSSSELQFRTSEWESYTDIDWNEVSSLLSTFGGDGSVSFNLNHSAGLYSNAFTFYGNGAWRQYGFINEEAEIYSRTSTVAGPGGTPVTVVTPDPRLVEEAHKQQFRQSFFSTSYGFSHTLRPLYRSSVWGQSSLQYSFKTLLVKSSFIETSTADAPDWELLWGDWIKEKMDIHQLSANLNANIMDKTQNLTLTAELPPRDVAYSGNATFRVWITETNARMRVFKPGETDQKFEPFYGTETVKFGSFGSLVQYLVLDTEKKELETLSTTLSLWGLRAEYTAARSSGYDFIPARGWVVSTDEPKLQSKAFTLSYSGNFAKTELWNKRLNFSLNANSQFLLDLQRYTNSSFTQTVGFTLGINGFVDLTLSTTSSNAVVFRYIKDWPIFSNLPVTFPPGEQNDLFIDLLNSFRFDDDNRRRSSGFKLKNFRLSANHHLGDWNAILDIIMSPYLPMGSRQYELNSDFAFLVQWVPVGEIKSDIKYDQKTDKWVIE
jgi:hypothetical protein